MYVEKLEIRNFRNFAQTELTLDYPGRISKTGTNGNAALGSVLYLPNVNLFLGGNGSGKTSVFRALCSGILAPVLISSGFQAEYLVRRKAQDRQVDDSRDKATFKDKSDVRAHLRLDEIDTNSKSRSVIGEVTIVRTGDVEGINAKHKRLGTWIKLYQNNSPGFFVSGYGANRRSERPEGYSEQSRATRYQRVAGLFEEHVGLAPFTYGYLQLDDLGYLVEARTILNSILPDLVELTSRRDAEQRPLFDRDGILLPFNALSDGFRTFVGWVWDLLVHIARVQPKETRGKLADMNGVVER